MAEEKTDEDLERALREVGAELRSATDAETPHHEKMVQNALRAFSTEGDTRWSMRRWQHRQWSVIAGAVAAMLLVTVVFRQSDSITPHVGGSALDGHLEQSELQIAYAGVQASLQEVSRNGPDENAESGEYTDDETIAYVDLAFSEDELLQAFSESEYDEQMDEAGDYFDEEDIFSIL